MDWCGEKKRVLRRQEKGLPVGIHIDWHSAAPGPAANIIDSRVFVTRMFMS
jgi:hypothetical protein